MPLDFNANTPTRLRRAFAGAERELARLGEVKVRRWVFRAEQLSNGDPTSQRLILDVLPPGMQLSAQYIAIEEPMETLDGQTVTAIIQRSQAPVSDASTWTNVGTSTPIGQSVAEGTTVGSDSGFVCWTAPQAVAINFAGTNLGLLTSGRIAVALVYSPLRELSDDDGGSDALDGRADGRAAVSVLATGGTGSGGGAVELSDLTDVEIFGLAIGHVLTWNGITWSNEPPDLATVTKFWDYGSAASPSGTAIDLKNARAPISVTFDFGTAGAPVSP
jgi:hypothetical protein